MSNHVKTFFALLAFIFSAPLAVSSQDANTFASPKAVDNKAEQIIQRAIEAQGGRAYLDIRTVTGRGFFTQYEKGLTKMPSRFVDYQIFPDRERTEFRDGKVTVIQTNTGANGWIFDGLTRSIKDLTPAQSEDFKIAMRTSVDNILRGWWRKESAKLEYVGRREAGLAKRNEVVRLVYPDDFSVEYEFGAKDFLPAKILYRRKAAQAADKDKADKDKKENANGTTDTAAADEPLEEDRLLQYIMLDGINTPFVIDHYRNGKQTSRINFETVEFNKPINDSLFARPSDIKGLK